MHPFVGNLIIKSIIILQGVEAVSKQNTSEVCAAPLHHAKHRICDTAQAELMYWTNILLEEQTTAF